MHYEKKFFPKGINADAADFLVEPDCAINMENVRFGSADFVNSGVGYDESVGSTMLKTPTTVSLTLINGRHKTTNAIPLIQQYAYVGWFVIYNGGYYSIRSTEQTVLSSSVYPTLGPAPTSVSFNDLVYRGATQAEAVTNTRPAFHFITVDISFVATANLVLMSFLPTGVNYAIGNTLDEANNRILTFVWNANGNHCIYCYYIESGVTYMVMRNVDVTGGLGFDKDFPIHSSRVNNGRLYWTDNKQQPRRINIDSGIKLNHTFSSSSPAYVVPILQTNITLIRRTAQFPPAIEKKNSADIPSLVGYTQNFIANDATQFAIRYFFYDDEYSVIGEWSELAGYNYKDETFNVVQVTIPLLEIIEQDVEKVELIVRFGNSGTPFIIKTWDRNVPSEDAEIDGHNLSSTPLVYYFLNDQLGIAIDSAAANKPFDSVPLLSETLEIAKNRLFLGNNLEGYDAPTTTSLALSIVELDVGGGAPVTGTWDKIVLYYDTGEIFPPMVRVVTYILNVPSLVPRYFFFYAYTTKDGSILPPTIIDPNTADVGSNDYTDFYILMRSYMGYRGRVMLAEYTPNVRTPPPTISGTNPSSDSARVFKTNNTYRSATCFYDADRRKCSVVTNNGLKITTPKRIYNQVTFNKSIKWTLSNTNALVEIPDWATHYQVLLTRSLTTRFFMQGYARNSTYITRNSDGTFAYSTSGYTGTSFGIGIDISALSSYGMGYSFTDGDLVILYFQGVADSVELRIIGQDGSWLQCELQNVGTLNSTRKILFEIYTPYKSQVQEFYYEVGQAYAVVDAGLATRSYSITSGIFNGDISVLKRSQDPSNIFYAEAMSPNDKFWQNWFTDIGWPNIVSTIGQQRKTQSLSWSDTYISGTRSNGLSSFDALDEVAVPSECGEIQKLQLTSKVSEQGNVMLAICNNETASLYLGEVQVVASAENAFLASSPGVIGTINVLKGSFGTSNPEGVTEFRGNVYWPDVANGKFIQYGANGLFPISNYKMTRYWKLFCETYNSLTAAQIEAFGSRPFIYSGVDPHNGELLISVPRVLASPPNHLQDYPSMVYPFDIWDGQAKSIVYKLDAEPNWFQGAFNIPAENFVYAQNKLFSFKNGLLYQHNSETSFNNFYGTQYKSRIMYVSNSIPNKPKVYNNISIEANLIPTLTYFLNKAPYLQISDLMDFDWKNLEGIFYTNIYRNKIVPTATGQTLDGLMTAEKLRATALYILHEWTVSNVPLQFKFSTIGYTISLGQPV